MYKLLIIFIVFFTTIISCDGRDRKHKSKEEVIKESVLLVSPIEIIEYIPEAYTEIKTDTLLSNRFRVKYKFCSNMKNSVLIETFKDSINHKTYYRDFDVLINISKNGKELFSKLITKDFFHKQDYSTKGKLDNAILKDLIVDEFQSVKNAITIKFDYYPEQKDRQLRYKLVVHQDGTYKVINEFVIF